MKATSLLERELKNIEELSETVEFASANIQKSLLPQLAVDVAAQLSVEERVLLPELERLLADRLWLVPFFEQIARARTAMQVALLAPLGSQDASEAFGALHAALRHHSQAVRNSLLPRVDACLSNEASRRLAQRMMAVHLEVAERGANASGLIAFEA